MMVEASPFFTKNGRARIPSLHGFSLLFSFILFLFPQGSVVALFSKYWTKKLKCFNILLLYSIQICVGSAKLWKKNKENPFISEISSVPMTWVFLKRREGMESVLGVNESVLYDNNV